MTVSSEISQVSYDTDGVTTAFPVPFYFLANDHLRVWLFYEDTGVEVDLVLGSSFLVTGAGNPAGGTVTTSTAYPVGPKLRIERVVPITQETAYQRNDPFPERAHERALDKLTMICQQLAGFFGLLPGSTLRALLLGRNDVDGQGAYRARNNRIQDLADPKADQDAVNRRSMFAFVTDYVDRAIAGVVGGFGWFLQWGIGSIYRTFQDKMRDSVSVRDFIDTPIDGVTSNQVGIQNAITAALNAGEPVLWPHGVYVSTDQIQNFHLVRHIGPGIIKRGSFLFRPAPKGNEANVLYIKSPTGPVAGDGISPDFPLTNLQAALDALMFRGYVDGAWAIDLPAGNYSGAAATGHLGHRNESLPSTGAYFRDGVFFRNSLLIKGADVGYQPATNPEPVPTTVFNGAGIANGLHLEDSDLVVIRDIKFKDYTSSGGSGILADDTNIRTENVHTENCWFGISGLNYVRLEIKGGVIYGNTNTALSRTGIRALFDVKLEIGNQLAGGRGQGPRIEANRIGLLAQEGTTGHTDFVTYVANGVGIRLPSRSRVNCSGSSFARHLQAIRADTSCDIFYTDGSVEFFTGTADANVENVVKQTGATLSGDSIDTYANSGLATDYLNSPFVLTGTTTSTPVLAKILKRGYFSPVVTSARKPILIEVVGHGTFAGAGGTKQIKMRMGGSLIGSTTTDPGITGPFQFHWVGMIRSPNSQSGSIAVLTHLNPTRVNAASLSLDMNGSDITLQFEAQLGSAGDSITIESCVFKTWG